MKPVVSTIDVSESPEQVYDHLDVLANHEAFTDHFLVDWEVSGPPSGVGALARMRVKRPGSADHLEMEVIAAERPSRNVEQAVSAGGKRRTQGTYTLEPLPGGGTRIEFQLDWLEAPLPERMLAPLTRSIARRANTKALRRLAQQLEGS
jgi:ribosome-associated toxin RatA of RatAB toxin-antitoxin module